MITVHNQPSKPCATDLAPGGGADWGELVHLFERAGYELGRHGWVRVGLDPYSRRLRQRRPGARLQR